ncbi:MAG: hypothetical protein ACJAXW_003751 [Candidatus Azotimanducaceae bacterium]|jgi:hypothetical protein
MTEATAETTTEAVAAGQNRKKLVMMFSIGFVPLIVSWLIFFYAPELMPSSTTNEGELITPPVSASALGLMSETGRWTLLVPMPKVCNEACEERFYMAKQVNTALGKRADRVHRVLVDLGASSGVVANLTAQYPGLETVRVDAATFAKALPREDVIYLMDPLGNILMFYESEKAGNPMLKDIKHLLKISAMG